MVQDSRGGAERLVGEKPEPGASRSQHEGVSHPLVCLGVIQEAPIVDALEAIKGSGSTRIETALVKRATDQHRGAVAHHSCYPIRWYGRAAELGNQLADRVREIPERVDEGSIQIEDDQEPLTS